MSVICLSGRFLDGFGGFPTEGFRILAGGSSFFPLVADVRGRGGNIAGLTEYVKVL